MKPVPHHEPPTCPAFRLACQLSADLKTIQLNSVSVRPLLIEDALARVEQHETKNFARVVPLTAGAAATGSTASSNEVQ